MRADRLLQIVMLLQSRGATTAERLARELGVSRRTIYRDMEALDTAGVPIVAEAGPSGGYTLLAGYRSELTGLTEEEVAALGLITIPGASADLGVSEALRRAVEKILASVPRFASSAGERIRERILVNPFDAEGRGGEDDVGAAASAGADGHPPRPAAPGTLSRLQSAVLGGRRVSITLNLPFSVRVAHIAEPLGLVFDAGQWHLIYAPVGLRSSKRPRSLRLAGIAEAVVLEDSLAVASGFDLRAFWAAHALEARRHATSFAYEIRVAPSAVADVRRSLGTSMGVSETGAAETWPLFRCTAPDIAAARTALLPLGGAVEVIGPTELRRSIADYAEQAASLYRRDR